ncbi:MAG: AraC family transcriptional regulator [Clostridia bacterium]|nr:AraC family transcriptional regulator [Clostridia bacterium]
MQKADAVNWIDAPKNSDGCVILTNAELGIPGIRMFGKGYARKAEPALVAHYHANCLEFVFIENGTYHFTVNNQSYDLSGGDMFITLPNEVHDTGTENITVNAIYWFQIDTSNPDAFFYLVKEEAQNIMYHLNNLKTRVIRPDAPKTRSLLAQVFALFSPSSQQTRNTGAFLLLFFICQLLDDTFTRIDRLTRDIWCVIHYIQDNLSLAYNLDQLAGVAGLSTSRFKQKFKTQLGMSPREYINAEKVKSAKQMLKEGKPVARIAEDLGFMSNSYFSVFFHRYVGYSPRQYRDKNRAASNRRYGKG